MSADKPPSQPSLLRRLWVRYVRNNCCPCAHSHNETADSCWFCHWCRVARNAPCCPQVARSGVCYCKEDDRG